MSGAMTHHHPHQHYHVNWYFLVVLLAAVAVLGGVLVEPYLTTREAAVIPVTGNQNAYTEYLRGEKVAYSMPGSVTDAMTAYHLDERAFYTKTISSSNALSLYHSGEKYVMTASDYALLTYRQGEKDY